MMIDFSSIKKPSVFLLFLAGLFISFLAIGIYLNTPIEFIVNIAIFLNALLISSWALFCLLDSKSTSAIPKPTP